MWSVCPVCNLKFTGWNNWDAFCQHFFNDTDHAKRFFEDREVSLNG